MVILPSTLLYVHVPHRHPAVWDILLSSLILNELCCNFEMKTELVYSLQKLQACVTRLKKLGRIRLSRAFPSTVEHKSTIELTLWHRIPALNGQESSLIDMWKLAESSSSISLPVGSVCLVRPPRRVVCRRTTRAAGSLHCLRANCAVTKKTRQHRQGP